jgi:hypothetical protein
MSVPAQAVLSSPESSAQRRRVALIVDGYGWASRAVVSSPGAAGWQVPAPYGPKSSRAGGRFRQTLSEYLSLGFALPLVQEWVPGRSIGVAAVISHGRVLGWGAREAFSQFPTRGGSAVWRATVGPQEPGVAQALALLQQFRFEGMGDVRYHIDRDETPRLMEIGARTYGWLPLTIAAGADLPRIAADALGGHHPGQAQVARPGLHMRWLRGEGARIAEMLRPEAELPPGAHRVDVVRRLYPLCVADMLYDGWTVSDRRLRWRR